MKGVKINLKIRKLLTMTFLFSFESPIHVLSGK